jgi:hypothetical protein
MTPAGYQKLDQFLHQQLAAHVEVKPPAALIRKGQKQLERTRPQNQEPQSQGATTAAH